MDAKCSPMQHATFKKVKRNRYAKPIQRCMVHDAIYMTICVLLGRSHNYERLGNLHNPFHLVPGQYPFRQTSLGPYQGRWWQRVALVAVWVLVQAVSSERSAVLAFQPTVAVWTAWMVPVIDPAWSPETEAWSAVLMADLQIQDEDLVLVLAAGLVLL
jgi:hypothetical protein